MRPSLVAFAALLGGVTAARLPRAPRRLRTRSPSPPPLRPSRVEGPSHRRRRHGRGDRRPPGRSGDRPPAHDPRPRARPGRLGRQGDLPVLARHQLEPHPGAVERHRAQRPLSRRLRLVDALDRRHRAHRGRARALLGALRLGRARRCRPARHPPRRRRPDRLSARRASRPARTTPPRRSLGR